LGSPLRGCGTPVAELPTQKPSTLRARSRFKKNKPQTIPPPPQESYTDRLSPSLQLQSPTANLVYAVSVLNSYGRSAGLSNEVQVPSAPTLPPPANLGAQLTGEGVRLTWSAVAPPQPIPQLRYVYRVFRRDVVTNHDAIAGELPVSGEPSPSLLDSGFEWEKTYEYRVTVVTLVERPSGAEQVEGDDSPPVRVVAHDVFPPATPTGLQAVFSGPGQKPFIDLVWTANIEPDLAGYNVYRHEIGNIPNKMNLDLVTVPAFRDFYVLPGHHYFYSVSAVDTRGNESRQSKEASVSVP
jgi:hypothetical protein